MNGMNGANGDVASYETMLTDSGSVTEELAAAEEGTAAPEPFSNSWKALLGRNIGRTVIVSFLMGTQSTVVAEGVLYEIGSDYLVLYQPSRDSYITADLYSVKFVEFRAADNRPPKMG